MPQGPELVVPNVVYDGQVDLIYSFTGQSDDGGITYAPAEPITAGEYAYSFECLGHEGDVPMHVSLCGLYDIENDRIRGTTEPGLFNGTIEVTEDAAAHHPQAILLSVTGTPTIAKARNLSVRRIIG